MADSKASKEMESPQSSRDPAHKGIVGLMNLGNTCYANSTIQIIRAVPELSALIVSDDLESKIINKSSKEIPTFNSSLNWVLSVGWESRRSFFATKDSPL
jgi:ubiquitin C-terminal hydrolase